MKCFAPKFISTDLPSPESDHPYPCHAGFEGLDETQQAAHAEILHRAHSIWLSNGCPENSQMADWLKAEAEVLSER